MGERRKRPPRWLWVVWGLAALGIVAVRSGDLAGDRGIANVVSALVALLALAVGLAWFAGASGFSLRLRLGLPLALMLGVVLARQFLRVEGVSGDLIPRLAWRSDAPDGDHPGTARLKPGSPSGESGAGERGKSEAGAGRSRVDLATETSADYPGFLGARGDATVDVRLARDWDARPPELVWKRPIGAGWSGIALVNGWAVTLEQAGDHVVTAAIDVATGERAWTRSTPGRFTHFLGGDGPRSTPAIQDGRVFTLDPAGRLACLDGRDGSLVWERDLLADYGVTSEDEAKNVQYGRSNSPLVTGGKVIVPAGGNPLGKQANLAAFDVATGALVWEGPPRQISFATPRLATLGGVEQILIVNEDTFSGHDPASGRMLFEHPWPGRTPADANVSQAVPVPPDRVLVSKGYGGGALLVELVPRADGTFDVRELWRDKRILRTKFTNVVLFDGHVYGLDEGTLECVELGTGRVAWKEGRYGHGQILLAGELLLVVGEEGEVSLVAARPDRANEVLGRFQALEGKTWNNPALHGELLVVRNAEEMAVWRLALEPE